MCNHRKREPPRKWLRFSPMRWGAMERWEIVGDETGACSHSLEPTRLLTQAPTPDTHMLCNLR